MPVSHKTRPHSGYSPCLLAATVLASLLLPACAKKQWHYTPPPAPAPSKDFDAQFDAAHLDPNGAALNLDWHPQLAGRIPDPDACDQGQPYSSACTQNNPFQDQPNGFNAAICSLGKVFSGHPIQPFFGHADWMVAQQTGAIGWFNFGADFDYGLLLVPRTDSLPPQNPPHFNGHGITTNNSHVSSDQSPQYIEVEFDSDETDPVFTQGWWKNFQTDGENDDTAQLATLLHPSDPTTLACGSVVGLFGLDCDHGCRSELHPVYGLAIQRTEDPSKNEWSILARNWGTGGYCSQYNDELDQTSLSLLLPYSSPQKPTAVVTDFVSTGTKTAKISCPKIYFWNGQAAVYLKLPRPAKQAVASFTLTLQWPAGAHSVACTQVRTEDARMAHEREISALVPPRPGEPPQEFEGHGEDYMGRLLHGMDPLLVRMQKESVRQSLAAQNSPRAQRLARMNANRRQEVCTAVEVIDGPPPQPKPTVKTLSDLKPDPVKTARDEAIQRKICSQYNQQHPPPVGNMAQLKAACQSVVK
jgi:hypothetical protein